MQEPQKQQVFHNVQTIYKQNQATISKFKATRPNFFAKYESLTLLQSFCQIILYNQF